jgi:ATP-dependent Zn protease
MYLGYKLFNALTMNIDNQSKPIVDTLYKFDDIYGMDEAKNELREIIDYL